MEYENLYEIDSSDDRRRRRRILFAWLGVCCCLLSLLALILGLIPVFVGSK